MKKGLFGYKISDTEIILNTLRKENESLNSIIKTLQRRLQTLEEDNLKYKEMISNKTVLYQEEVVISKETTEEESAGNKEERVNPLDEVNQRGNDWGINPDEGETAAEEILVKEEVAKESIVEESMIIEEVAGESIAEESMVIEEVAKESTEEESMIIGDVAEEGADEESMTQKAIMEEDSKKEDIAEEGIKEEGIVKEDIDKEEITKGEKAIYLEKDPLNLKHDNLKASKKGELNQGLDQDLVQLKLLMENLLGEMEDLNR